MLLSVDYGCLDKIDYDIYLTRDQVAIGRYHELLETPTVILEERSSRLSVYKSGMSHRELAYAIIKKTSI